MSSTPAPPTDPIKRIVTGHNEAGQSIFSAVDTFQFKPMRDDPTVQVSRAWVTKDLVPNNDALKEDTKEVVPERFGLVQPNGSHAFLMQLGPGGESPLHRTNSIDYIILISGEVTLIMEDGSEELITQPGSIVVQRGTLHRWQNRSKDWTQYVCVMIDAKPAELSDKDGNKKTLKEEFFP